MDRIALLLFPFFVFAATFLLVYHRNINHMERAVIGVVLVLLVGKLLLDLRNRSEPG